MDACCHSYATIDEKFSRLAQISTVLVLGLLLCIVLLFGSSKPEPSALLDRSGMPCAYGLFHINAIRRIPIFAFECFLRCDSMH